jgi:hypothetical protein
MRRLVEWWPDMDLYSKLVGLFGSPERALEELHAALSSGAVRSVRYPRQSDGVPWDQRIENTTEFWHGRKYLRVGPSIIILTIDGVEDSEWGVSLSSEGAHERWPGLGVISGHVSRAETGHSTGRKASFDWVEAATLFGVLIFAGKIIPEKISAREATTKLLEELDKIWEETPAESTMREKVGPWLKRYRAAK